MKEARAMRASPPPAASVGLTGPPSTQPEVRSPSFDFERKYVCQIANRRAVGRKIRRRRKTRGIGQVVTTTFGRARFDELNCWERVVFHIVVTRTKVLNVVLQRRRHNRLCVLQAIAYRAVQCAPRSGASRLSVTIAVVFPGDLFLRETVTDRRNGLRPDREMASGWELYARRSAKPSA